VCHVCEEENRQGRASCNNCKTLRRHAFLNFAWASGCPQESALRSGVVHIGVPSMKGLFPALEMDVANTKVYHTHFIADAGLGPGGSSGSQVDLSPAVSPAVFPSSGQGGSSGSQVDLSPAVSPAVFPSSGQGLVPGPELICPQPCPQQCCPQPCPQQCSRAVARG
jgi:hypothetical protein